jgi:S-adenosylmethionine:tRNA ribosyltransferase-isomerase
MLRLESRERPAINDLVARSMLTDEFDFDLPTDRIAQYAVEPRDQSRLMVIDRESGRISHQIFADLPELLRSGDVLVRNDSKVLPARLRGVREATGGAWEGLFLRSLHDGTWEILAKTRGRVRDNEAIVVDGSLRLCLRENLGEGRWIVTLDDGRSAIEVLEQYGEPPLPPYIRKGKSESADRDRYQTIYAREPGSVAAPTAGLHFTSDLWTRLDRQGVQVVDLTLHVGIGTFRPIEAKTIDEHVMHSEWAQLSAESASILNNARAAGARVIAIGTTSARTLESATVADQIEPFSGETAIYLKPGHRFRSVDALITNFHLPRSSLFVLVCAFGGVPLIKNAYDQAIQSGYRFYSYGDAMVII